MYSETKKAKIRRFMDDIVMHEAVKEVITKAYLKPRPTQDIYVMAAERMAIDLLEEGFNELKKIASEQPKEPKQAVQQGL